jgi:hypothetical protein
VDELRARRELGQLAGHAVVEAGPDRHDQVGLVHRVVRGASPVHPQHAEPLVVVGGECAEAHQRARDREALRGAQLAELLGRVRVDHAAAAVDHRPACVGQRFRGEPDLLQVALRGGLVAGQVQAGDRLVRDVGA